MTVIASHLRCDCEKALQGSNCPAKLLSPKIEQEHPYYYCPECKFDYICENAIHSEFTSDKDGFPIKTTVCVKCKTDLVRKVWPSESEVIS